MSFFLPLGYSFQLLSIHEAEVDNARDNSWRACFMVCLYLVTKPSHMGGRCGWATPAYGCSCQMRGHGLLSGAILSCRCSGWCHLLGDVKPSGVDIW
jgi:hypothetical protein